MIDTKNKIIAFETSLLRTSPDIVQDGYEIRDCNLNENLPHTKKFAGIKNLTLINCPVKNCDFPADTLFVNCAWKGVHEEPDIEQPEEQNQNLPDLQETVNNALILAENKTVEFSQALKETAGIEKIVGLVNASEGAKVEVVNG